MTKGDSGMNDRIKDMVKHITAANNRFYHAAQCVADEKEIMLRVSKCLEAYDALSDALHGGLMKEPWERGE
jgi:hypothetical protein